MESIIQTKFIEVPYGINMSDKIMLLNMWLGDLQRNGIIILSTSQLQRIDKPDGTFVEGFTIEWKEGQ